MPNISTTQAPRFPPCCWPGTRPSQSTMEQPLPSSSSSSSSTTTPTHEHCQNCASMSVQVQRTQLLSRVLRATMTTKIKQRDALFEELFSLLLHPQEGEEGTEPDDTPRQLDPSLAASFYHRWTQLCKLNAGMGGNEDEATALLQEVDFLREERQALHEALVASQAQARGVQAEEESIITELQHKMLTLQREKHAALQSYGQESAKRKALHDKLLEIQGNIRVFCRVRPLAAPLPVRPSDLVDLSAAAQALAIRRNDDDDSHKLNYRDVTELPTPEDIVVTRDDSRSSKFSFDRVFGPGATQTEIYEVVAPLLTSVLDGYSVCIFAHGQTGSGKTHTMKGPPSDRGVNYRALTELFRLRDARKDEMKYTFQLSMLEIYNETIRDLLVSVGGKEGRKEGGRGGLEMKMQVGGEGRSEVVGLTMVEVSTEEEVVKLMQKGEKNRAVGSHGLNADSSRSHSVLSLQVRGEGVEGLLLPESNSSNSSSSSSSSGRNVTFSKLHLCDLAGSERMGKTGATGEQLKEAQNINLSLLAFGDVISALADKQTKKERVHVPYRNSKLTRVLEDALGAQGGKVAMFCNISPAAVHVNESLCSLNFASRCRSVALGPAKKGVVVGGGGGGGGGGGEEGVVGPPVMVSARKSTTTTMRK